MRTLVFALLSVVAAGPVAGQQGPVGSAPPALEEDVRKGIDDLFVDLDRTDTPGCAVGVVVDGALVFADGYGSANLDHELPITPTTVFYMGSVSKQFTAASVALAARGGHLSLDDPVRKWFPELPEHADGVTVRHLVHHTSGIRDYLTLQGITGSFEGTTDEEILELLARQRALNFPPGERYLYSNSGYFLLSELLERATGLTLREFAGRHFLGPLGMRSSHFHDDPDHVVPNRATGYSPLPDDGGSAPGRDAFRMNHAWGYSQVGAGGLYSNVDDLARWEAAFEDGRIGPPGFRDSLLRRGVLNDGDTLSYAFGLSLSEHRGVPVIAHGGSLAGFRSQVARFPEQRTSIFVLCNRSDAGPGDRARKVADLVLGDALEPPVAAEPTAEEPPGRSGPEPPRYDRAELEAFAGRYYSPELGAHLTVAPGEEGLVLEGSRGRRGRLTPLAPDTFRGGPYRLEFQREADGEVSGFVLDAGRADGLVFERVEGGGP